MPAGVVQIMLLVSKELVGNIRELKSPQTNEILIASSRGSMTGQMRVFKV